MTKKNFFLCFIILLFSINVFADSGSSRYHTIIDTDCAADDLRAICMLLASDEVEVIAISTSDGALNPLQAYHKVKALLKSFGHEGIPVVSGKSYIRKIPDWRKLSNNIQWGKNMSGETGKIPDATDKILSFIKSEEEPVIMVCMGSLTNIASVIANDPQIVKEIERIIWYNEKVKPLSGSNYEADKQSAKYIINREIKLEIINNQDNKLIAVNKDYIERLNEIQSPYAHKIAKTHMSENLVSLINEGHLKFWDDQLVLFLLKPEMYENLTTNIEGRNNKAFNLKNNIKNISDDLCNIIAESIEEKSIVFSSFPTGDNLFLDDVLKYKDQIIRKYGMKEWRICVITNEFHEHLGIYSILGAKMGLRAREYFNVGHDQLKIKSFAGSKPPVSCLNDGLQTSTGATIGHGTIAVINDEIQKAEAIFSFKDYNILVKLKEKFVNQIRNDIKITIKDCGLNTEAYWAKIREIGLQYWLDFDRKEIFEIVEITNT